MRLRFDSVSASSVLLTISLLVLVPHNLKYAATWKQIFLQEAPRLWVQNYLMPIGFASLAIVVVGLMVIWAGYIKRERWAWFALLAVAGVFVFPVYVLPLLLHVLRTSEPLNWSAWLWAAIASSGVERQDAKGPADFLLMVFALLLPIRSFFRRADSQILSR